MLPARATVLAEWLSPCGRAGRRLRPLLGREREAAASGAPSSAALGLGSADHSSFTAEREREREREHAVPRTGPLHRRAQARPASSAGPTLGQVVQLHHAEVAGRAAAPAAPAAPAQRQHHSPVHVGEHQGHTDTCGHTKGHCPAQPSPVGPRHPPRCHPHRGQGPRHSPTVRAVMMGDTKRDRRTLLVTERHCWHPERLLRRLWPSTSGTR